MLIRCNFVETDVWLLGALKTSLAAHNEYHFNITIKIFGLCQTVFCKQIFGIYYTASNKEKQNDCFFLVDLNNWEILKIMSDFIWQTTCID